jgi:parallel beta-helix repeat protein
MKKVIVLFLVLLLNQSTDLLAQLPYYWPITSDINPTADRITSPFGARVVGTKHQYHYGIDLKHPDWQQNFIGTQVHAPMTGKVVDIFNTLDDGEGTILIFEFININSQASNQKEYLIFLHSNASLSDLSNGLNYQIGDVVNFAQPLYLMGDGNGEVPLHLHLQYIPKAYANPGEIIFTENRRYSANPVAIFDTYQSEYQIDNFRIENQSGDLKLLFDIDVDRLQMDLNRVEVTFDSRAQGLSSNQFIGYASSNGNSEYDPIIKLIEQETLGQILESGNSNVSVYETITQAPGVIDFEGRMGYDFTIRENDRNEPYFNGVKIIVTDYPGSTSGGTQKYSFEFDLDEDVLKNTVGGLTNIEITGQNTYFDQDLVFTSFQLPEYNDIAWTQNWKKTTNFHNVPNTINVVDGGKIVIIEDGSSSEEHVVVYSDITIESGGVLEIKSSSNSSEPNIFRHFGNLNIEPGGELILGDNTRVISEGEFVNNGTIFKGINAEFLLSLEELNDIIVSSNQSISTDTDFSGLDLNLADNITYTIEAHATFNNSNIILGENSKIEVINGGKLTVTNSNYKRREPNKNFDGLYLYTNGNEIRNTSIEGGNTAISLINSNNNVLEYVTVKDNSSRGLYLSNSSYNTINNSVFEYNEDGIRFNANSNFNNFTNIQSRFNWNGVYSRSSSNNEFKLSTLEQNGIGMLLYTSQMRIRGVAFKNNQDDGLNIIDSNVNIDPNVTGGSPTRSLFKDNADHGIYVVFNSVLDLYNSDFSGNVDDDIYIDQSSRVKMGYYNNPFQYFGNNNFGSASSLRKYIYSLAMTTSGESTTQWTIPARKNYWNGDTTPSSWKFHGSVDYSYALSDEVEIPSGGGGGVGCTQPPCMSANTQQFEAVLSSGVIHNQLNDGTTETELDDVQRIKVRLNEIVQRMNQTRFNPRITRWMRTAYGLIENVEDKSLIESEIEGLKDVRKKWLVRFHRLNSLEIADTLAHEAATINFDQEL